MADIFDKIVAEQQSAAAASQPASQAVPPTQTSAQTASSKPAGDIFDQVVAGTAKDPWDNPAPSNSGQAAQPSILSRALSGAGQSLENNFVEPAKAAYKAVVEPPSTSAEQLAHATGGDLGLAAFRAGKAVVDSVQNLTQAPKENYEQAKQDVQRAVNDFHNKDYRNAASSVGSTAADIVGMVPGDVNSLAATRARELTEGARPGGDLATPLAKDVTDIAGMALADRVFFKDSNGGVHSVPHDQLDAALKIDPKLRILEKAKGFTKFAMPDKPELETVPAPDMGKVVETEKPVSDATIVKKMGGKKLSEGARQTFKEHAGDTIPAGSSPQNHIYKAVGIPRDGDRQFRAIVIAIPG